MADQMQGVMNDVLALRELLDDLSELWHAGAAAPEFEEDRQTILGLDASWTRDSTALVMVQRDKVARLHAWAQVWRKDGALGHIDHEAVEAKILDLCETYKYAGGEA
jgi:phage terminase large subunit-like protein